MGTKSVDERAAWTLERILSTLARYQVTIVYYRDGEYGLRATDGQISVETYSTATNAAWAFLLSVEP